jgi:hypothetical protein
VKDLAEILKVTTPLSKAHMQPYKQNMDPANAFTLKDTAAVVKPMAREDILEQYNGLARREDGVLANLLRDPRFGGELSAQPCPAPGDIQTSAGKQPACDAERSSNCSQPFGSGRRESPTR